MYCVHPFAISKLRSKFYELYLQPAKFHTMANNNIHSVTFRWDTQPVKRFKTKALLCFNLTFSLPFVPITRSTLRNQERNSHIFILCQMNAIQHRRVLKRTILRLAKPTFIRWSGKFTLEAFTYGEFFNRCYF